jgi:cytoskeletal protein CcmA (bactofilin family)
MFNKKDGDKKEIEEKEIETVIGPSVKVKGNFSSQGNIVIEGLVEGSIKTGGNLLVENSAKILASVEAKEAKIAGEIKGNIKIKGYLEISSTGKIFGDIECSLLSVEQGAIIEGRISMIIGEQKGKKEEGNEK